MIANLAGADVRPGLDGPAAARRRGRRSCAAGHDGRAAVPTTARVEVVEEPGRRGRARAAARVAVDVPRLPRTRTSATPTCFAGGWYLTGDLARRDADGYFWFVGRADDVIKSAGHLIGPFEVESALMEHPAVVEAGVIGVPDPVAGEVVKAFVALRPGFEPTDELRRELIGFARTPARRRPWRPARSSSTRTCPRPGAARSCAGCSRPASSACPKATSRRWRAAP